MLFDTITPEQAGISSANVAAYIEHLNRRGCTTHSLLMMRGDKLFAEYYWAPFHRGFHHRMYSQTKSYVSLAIGLLWEDGKVDLDAPILSYFPEKIDRSAPPYLAKQTVRDMLTMTTCGRTPSWFTHAEPDRTRLYMNTITADHPAGTFWEYDSPGSQVLASLVEKITGKRMIDFLRERLFNKMGTFQTAQILQTRNGDSWGDSALLCTARDMVSCARLVLNYGNWYGEQLMSEEYLRAATARQVDNAESYYDDVLTQGYGYQIWRTEDNGFCFVGMGDQITVMLPDKDLIFSITSDNQGFDAATKYVIAGFFDYIARPCANAPLPADPAAEKKLAALTADLRLRTVSGEKDSPWRNAIHGVEFVCEPNSTTITRFRFDFTEDGGVLHYTNAQGDKEIPFGMCRNVFAKFPQYGYSNEVGGARTTDGFLYDGAFSAAWRTENRLLMRIQIIDRYFGNASFAFTFKGDECSVVMVKTAEDFLGEYQGRFVAHRA